MTVTVYSSYREVPLDDPPPHEYDDTVGLVDPYRNTPAVRALMSLAPTVPQNIVMPFRPVNRGDVGDNVYAAKRTNARYRGKGRLVALQTAPPAQRRTFGRFFQTDLSATQERLGIARTGRWDEPTWRALAPYADAFSLSLLQAQPWPTEIRLQLGWLSAFYNRRWEKNYTQKRPSELGPADRVDDADCSGMVAASCNFAGILPRVDWRWTNTDVQALLGQEVERLRNVRVGDVVLYGHGNDPNHETIVVDVQRLGQNGVPQITVQSFGSEPVRLLNIDYDRGTRGGRIMIRRFVP
jgi:hypothetical protein